MRSNLLSLQNTVDLLNRTQNRLATGKKVNTAIDNPVNFFASQSLNSRASKIDSLKDSMGQAIQTINAADKGITSITSMIEQAKAIAQSAMSADNSEGVTRVSLAVNKDVTAFQAGTASLQLTAVVTTDAFTIKDGATTIGTLTVDTDFALGSSQAETAQNLADAINKSGSVYQKAGYSAIVTGDTVKISKVGETVASADITGTGVAHCTATQVAATAGDTVVLGSVTLTAGTDFDVSGSTDAAKNKALADAINNNTTLTDAGYSATVENDKVIVGYAPDGLPTGISTADVSETVTNAGAIAEADVAAETTELTNLQGQYNELRNQITALAGDSGYKGKNLLNGDNLTVKFEGADLTVEGFSASAADMKITTATWTTGGQSAIESDLNVLDKAMDTLSQNASTLSGNLSIITTRQEFSTNMINTLTTGSDKLTLADTNEEGANMLMLQTRQSLATTALSLSSQASQSVLRLFQ